MSGLDSEINIFSFVLPHKLIRMVLAMGAKESVHCTIFVVLTAKWETLGNHFIL